ncbi:MAG: deoxyribodipyrimidine photo-lyase [Chitinophagales bacterium]|nr:deoxyribodipyrimidine photo-lyase [Chitinophagales bacterium]
MDDAIAVFWFRRDLRLDDNAGLYHALKSGLPVLPLFIFDTNILDELEDKADKRVLFIHQELHRLDEQLREYGSALRVEVGTPVQVWRQLIEKLNIEKVFTNHDFEPYAIERDALIKELLGEKGISFHTYKDHVIFEKNEVVKEDGTPYTVFTPYSRKWKSKLSPFYYKSYPTLKYAHNFLKWSSSGIPALESFGFKTFSFTFPERVVRHDVVVHYGERRDFPAVNGTSRLGIHLRFGTLSVRKLLAYALDKSPSFVNELIWRDFYQMILWHFPHVAHSAFRAEYNNIEWENDTEKFMRWCNGQTGYPIVDAGMRELNETGYMHNRVRMITASFLTKHLLIDWRWGEAYFAAKLLDFDLAANNGGWQWAAGSGTDAAPYFRIFNPSLQMQKFDPNALYVKKWVPEWGTDRYVKPIVQHEVARKKALEVYSRAVRIEKE